MEFNHEHHEHHEHKDHKEYKNKSELEFLLCDKHHTVFSNEVVAKKAEIKVKKYQSCNRVLEDDELEYTINICNDGCRLDNAVFCDHIPHGLKYVENSFTVDGHCRTPIIHDNMLKYEFCDIPEHSETTVCFKTVVL